MDVVLGGLDHRAAGVGSSLTRPSLTVSCNKGPALGLRSDAQSGVQIPITPKTIHDL